MTYSGAWRRLSGEEKFTVIYVALVALYLAWHYHRTTSTRSVDLDETRLQHLENGGTVRVPRWHGHTLELSGDVVVNANRLPVEEPEDDQEEPIE